MIAWFVRNGVAANLLMGVIAIGGLVTIGQIKLELFPPIDLDLIKITVPYRGSSPEEVEKGIVAIIEERIQDVEGIKKLSGVAIEGSGSVYAELEDGYSVSEIIDKIKVRVDSISNFPLDAERPVIKEVVIKNDVVSLAIFGDTNERTLKEIAERTREKLIQINGITQVEITGVRDYELVIEVSEMQLHRYNLCFDDIVEAIEDDSIDLPAGLIHSKGGQILIRTQKQAYLGSDFENIPIFSRSDGTSLLVKDVARVRDGFTDSPIKTFYNGQNAVFLRVSSIGDQDTLEIAQKVNQFCDEGLANLPQGISMERFRDMSFYLKGRLGMMIENGIIGLFLVFIVLSLFLRPSLAFFVILGIPVSFLGTFILMPYFDLSINLASLFAFILVLGIVVDDAIVVGESIFTHFENGETGSSGAIKGTHAVATPVTFAVLSTILAFIPLMNMGGSVGKFYFSIPMIVIFTLIWSLIQSKLILPYHLSNCQLPTSKDRISIISKLQIRISNGLETVINLFYRPFLRIALHNRYATITLFLSILLISLGFIYSGIVRFIFMPTVPSDYLNAKLVMSEGTPFETTQKAVAKMKSALDQLVKETKDKGLGNPFQNIVLSIGNQPFYKSGGPSGRSDSDYSENIAEIALELQKSEERIGGGEIKDLSSPALAKRWTQLIGQIPGAKEISFESNAAGDIGSPIDIQIRGSNFSELLEISKKIELHLATYTGLFGIKNDYSGGKREIKIMLKPSGEAMGITQREIGRQVRQAFHGEEVQRIQRGRDDLRVMVRYPKEGRLAIEHLQDLRVRLPNGSEILFSEIATAQMGQSYPQINRVDRKRVINITADADKESVDLEGIIESLTAKRDSSLPNSKNGFLEQLRNEYQNFSYSLEGEQREQREAFTSLYVSMTIAFCLIYALMAVAFRSYIQPFIILSVIPFGLIGVIMGHALMGYAVSIISILGLVALSGVLVNDSLVLVDYINRKTRGGIPLVEAVWESGVARFRPIFLTSMTTFFGLLPLLFEKSLQAQFLIPMAISLSFGILFATFMTLFLVPALYLILEDLKKIFSFSQ